MFLINHYMNCQDLNLCKSQTVFSLTYMHLDRSLGFSVNVDLIKLYVPDFSNISVLDNYM